jgi:hypothetical protein
MMKPQHPQQSGYHLLFLSQNQNQNLNQSQSQSLIQNLNLNQSLYPVDNNINKAL